MAESPPLKATEEKTNGTRLLRLVIDGGTDVLRKFLHSIYPPATLQHVLYNNYPKLYYLWTTKHIITNSQWETLFPASGHLPDSKTFDITLLCILFRNVCHLTAPSTGWDLETAVGDASPEANIVRIKYHRNELCHSFSTGFTNDEFEDKWDAISLALVSLGFDQKEIDHLKTEPIDHDTQRRVEEEVNKWKHQFESRMKDVERRQDNFEDRISTIEEKLPKVTIHELSSRLPDDVPCVYGRSKEVDEVVNAIQSGEEAVVLITGGPGFGKTTVAKRAARELDNAQHGTRAVLFCNAKSTKSLHEVATSMTLVCSEQPQLQEKPQLWLRNWSKQLERNVTFVLDNADDVLNSDNGDEFFGFVSDIRTLSKQKITFVITCRLECNATSLQTKNVRLGCLDGEDAKQVLLSRMKTQLQELSKADKLVELCGFVPIALCIAGSLLSKAVYTEEELIKCLKQDPLDVLKSNRRPTIDTSVEKSIMTSFDALEDCEKQALILLCSFPGSFDHEAAKVLIAPCLPTTTKAQQVLILTELTDRCLVEKPSTQRYEIHSLIQAAAKKIGRERYPQLLDQGKKLACDHFISRLADNANMYWSKDKCKESIEAFNEDRHNFEYFLKVYVRTMEKRDVDLLQTSTFLDDFPQKCMYLEMCLLPSFYILILEGLLKNFDRESQPVHTVELLCLLGHEKRKVGNQTQYKDLMQQAKVVYAGNYTEFRTNRLSQVLFFNSYASFFSGTLLPGKSELISEAYDIALRYCRLGKLNEHPETAATLLFIGRHQKSIIHLQEAMDLFRHCLGEHLMTALGHKAIADFYFVQHERSTSLGLLCGVFGGITTNLDKSFEHYGEALAVMEKLGMVGHKESILTLKNYGLCYERKGNYQEAINFLAKAKRVAEVELEDDHKWKVMIETQLALLYHKVGRVEEAKLFMKKGLEMCHRLEQSINKLPNRAEIKTFLSRYPDTLL